MNKLTVGEVAAELGRVAHTVRLWDLYGKLPEELRAHRDERGWRYWTEDQVVGIKQWLIDADVTPGKGIRK